MEPSEIEFLAEKDKVEVVPNFTANTLYLLEGDVGPFNAGLSLEVPIWLATDLRQRQKCRILQPDWMDPEVLEEVKEKEKVLATVGLSVTIVVTFPSEAGEIQ